MEVIKLGSFLLPLYRVVVVVALVALGLVSNYLGRKSDWRLGQWGGYVGWGGSVVARVGFVIANWPAYAVQPFNIIDLSHGGFSWVWGVVGGGIYTLWFFRRQPTLLRPATVSALVAAGVAAIGLTAVQATQPNNSPVTLPALTLYRLEDGNAVSLDSLKGKPLVLNVWATWCPPCRREMPMMAEAAKANPDVQFVFVDQGEGAEVVRTFLTKLQVPMANVWLDPEQLVSRSYRIVGLPTTVFFDNVGRRIAGASGELSRSILEVYLRRIR